MYSLNNSVFFKDLKKSTVFIIVLKNHKFNLDWCQSKIIENIMKVFFNRLWWPSGLSSFRGSPP